MSEARSDVNTLEPLTDSPTEEGRQMAEIDSSEKPLTGAELLALPIFGFGKVQLVSDENCEVKYRGHVIRTSEPNTAVNIPVMPTLLAHYVGPDDILCAVDKDGATWTPVLTERGWYRKSIRR